MFSILGIINRRIQELEKSDKILRKDNDGWCKLVKKLQERIDERGNQINNLKATVEFKHKLALHNEKGFVKVVKDRDNLKETLEAVKEFVRQQTVLELDGYKSLQECAEAGTSDAWWLLKLKEILGDES